MSLAGTGQPLNREHAQEHLDFLYGAYQRPVKFFLSIGREWNGKKYLHWNDRAFLYPNDVNAALNRADQASQEGKAVFATCRTFTSAEGRKKAHAEPYGLVVWGEIDEENADAETIIGIVKQAQSEGAWADWSGSGGVHIYYRLTEPVTSAELEKLNIALRERWNLPSVDSVHDMSRVLRLAGSYNDKTDLLLPVLPAHGNNPRSVDKATLIPQVGSFKVLRTFEDVSNSGDFYRWQADNGYRKGLSVEETFQLAITSDAPGIEHFNGDENLIRADVERCFPKFDGIPSYAADRVDAIRSREKPKATPRGFYSPEDHATAVKPMEWLVRNVWPRNTHGPLGGAKKSFKSYHALAISIPVASGKPYLDVYPVMTSGPVVYFIGEGGYQSWKRRLQRMCAAYGVNPKDVPVHATDMIASVDSPEFAAQVELAKSEFDPILFVLDPMYAYHPKDIEAQNLYSRGHMLANLSALIGHDRSLIIPDHYRKNGTEKLDLDELGQAGMSQWAHSWILQSHRKPYEHETGTARLIVEYGSREGYGRQKHLDMVVGTFNEDTGDHEGDISWELTSTTGEVQKDGKGAEFHTDKTLRDRLYGLLDNPKFTIDVNRQFTKTQGAAMLREIFAIGRSQGFSKFNECVGKGIIVETEKGGKFMVGNAQE